MQNNNINLSLIEVRKAYRILFDYQTRILDLISFISSKTQFTYNGGYSKFSNSGPNNGKGKLDLWAWDWLNFYYYEFKFHVIEKDNDKYTLSIFHLADDGFFDASSKNGNTNRTDLNLFTNESESNSKLIFVLGKNNWYDWGHNWNSTTFTLNEFEIYKDKDTCVLFKSYNLNKFIDEESAFEVLKDFEKFCASNQMAFEVSNKIL